MSTLRIQEWWEMWMEHIMRRRREVRQHKSSVYGRARIWEHGYLQDLRSRAHQHGRTAVIFGHPKFTRWGINTICITQPGPKRINYASEWHMLTTQADHTQTMEVLWSNKQTWDWLTLHFTGTKITKVSWFIKLTVTQYKSLHKFTPYNWQKMEEKLMVQECYWSGIHWLSKEELWRHHGSSTKMDIIICFIALAAMPIDATQWVLQRLSNY